VPITLGQEFGAMGDNVEHAAAALSREAAQLHELNLGATAVGTGLNAGDDYTRAAVRRLAASTGLPLRPARNHFRVTQSMGDVLAFSGALRRLAVEVNKVASDLRLLSMGPRAGIAESAAPGRPARVLHHARQGQPVSPRDGEPGLLSGVRLRRYGLRRADNGQLELNVMMPVIAWNRPCVAHSDQRHACAARPVRRRHRGRRGTVPRTARPQHRARNRLSPYIGYAETAEIAKLSVKTGRPIREIVRERGLLTDAELAAILSAEEMTTPGIPGARSRKAKPGARPAAKGKRRP
jgi:aspartate ammonia-lyase